MERKSKRKILINIAKEKVQRQQNSKNQSVSPVIKSKVKQISEIKIKRVISKNKLEQNNNYILPVTFYNSKPAEARPVPENIKKEANNLKSIIKQRKDRKRNKNLSEFNFFCV